MEFNQPRGGGSYLGSADILDQLILILSVNKIDRRFDEMAGRERDEVHVTFVNLTGDGVEKDGIITHKYVGDRLKQGDTNVLGRVVQLPAKRPGQNGAIILDRFSDEDAKLASDWIKKNGSATKPANDGDELDKSLSLLKAGLGQ